jgi:c-di-GMP-binding flagellar brake protein YcgR
MAQRKTTRRSERRRAPRADARLSMRVDPSQRDGAQIVTESQNISASGIYCQCGEYFSPASKVALTIVLPKLPGTRTAKELVKVEGIVVRCEPCSGRQAQGKFDMACMFCELDERLKARLDEFVTWRNLQALRTAAGLTASPRARRTGVTKAAPRAKARPRTKAAGARRRTVH